MARRPQRGLTSVGLIIDDLVILDRVLASKVFGCSEPCVSNGSRKIEAALKAYDAAPLLYNSKKTFVDADAATFWGVDYCGKSGLTAALRFWILVLITSRVLQLGLATRSLLQSLAGSWIAVFLLHFVFKPASLELLKASCAFPLRSIPSCCLSLRLTLWPCWTCALNRSRRSLPLMPRGKPPFLQSCAPCRAISPAHPCKGHLDSPHRPHSSLVEGA